MSDLNEVGARDGWRCWICDAAVDPDASVNSDLGPSVDSYFIAKGNAKSGAKGKKAGPAQERLAHRSCNTMKGKYEPVIPWPAELIAGDPAPIVSTVDRLERKGGREAVARFTSQVDAIAAGEWLIDRLGRFAPESAFSTQIKPGGGQYLLTLQAE